MLNAEFTTEAIIAEIKLKETEIRVIEAEVKDLKTEIKVKETEIKDIAAVISKTF